MLQVTSVHQGVGHYKVHHEGSDRIKGRDVTLRNVLIVMKKDTRSMNVEKHEKQSDFVITVAQLTI